MTIRFQSPVSYVEESRNYRWQQWLKELCEEFTVSKCQEIISKFHALYGPESMDMMVVRTVVGIEYQLQQLVNEYNAMLHKVCHRPRLSVVCHAMCHVHFPKFFLAAGAFTCREFGWFTP